MCIRDSPKSRLEQIQSVRHAQVVVTSADLKDAAADIFPTAELLTVEELREAEENPAALAAAQDAAIDTDPVYINFTSGSTGTPVSYTHLISYHFSIRNSKPAFFCRSSPRLISTCLLYTSGAR